jgi:hypothetical protein
MRWSNQTHQRCYIVSRVSVEELDKGLGKTLPQNYNVIGHNGLFNLREFLWKYKNMAQWTRENVLKCAPNRSGVRGQLCLGQLADTGPGKVW